MFENNLIFLCGLTFFKAIQFKAAAYMDPIFTQTYKSHMYFLSSTNIYEFLLQQIMVTFL